MSPLARTDHIATEERINPAHNHRIGDNHGHLALHRTHHALHGIRVRHRIWGRLASVLGCLEVRPGLVRCRQRIATGVERALGEHVVVLTDVDAVYKAALLAGSLLIEGFGRGGKENGRVVPQDAGQDLWRCELEGGRTGGGAKKGEGAP